MPTSAAIYARISLDRNGDMLGVARQIEDCQQLALQKGWPVGDIYVDDDRSAYSGKPRPDYLRMLSDIKDGLRDALVIYDHYRLIRRPMELEEFFLVCDAAGLTEIAQVSGGDLDLSTSDGQFKARILGAVAHKESADKSRRIRRKHLELARKGKHSGGGLRPYGYTKDGLSLVPEEAAIIRELVARFLAGDSLYSLVNDLNARAIPTSLGNRWTCSGLGKVLSNPRLAGQRALGGEIVAEAEWPAIITPEQSARIRLILSDPSRRVKRAPRTFLLSGMVRCELCGAVMLSTLKGPNRYYSCKRIPGKPGCGRMSVVAQPLETLVTEAVMHLLDRPDFAAMLLDAAQNAEGAETIEREIRQTQERLDQLAAALGANQMSFREWLIARDPIEAALKMLTSRLHQLSSTSALEGFVGNTDALRQSWPDLSLPRRQAVIRSVIHHVLIARPPAHGNTFNPERVKPVWRM